MAEGILRHLAGDKYDVVSAGTTPNGLHPRSVEVMKEAGIDVSKYVSKDLTQFLGQNFDYVITVCDRARQQCPVFPGAAPIHGFEDPAEAGPEAQLKLFAAFEMKAGIGSVCSCWQTKTNAISAGLAHRKNHSMQVRLCRAGLRKRVEGSGSNG